MSMKATLLKGFVDGWLARLEPTSLSDHTKRRLSLRSSLLHHCSSGAKEQINARGIGEVWAPSL